MGLGGLQMEGMSPGYNREGDKSIHLAGVTGDFCQSCSIGLFYHVMVFRVVGFFLSFLNQKIDNNPPTPPQNRDLTEKKPHPLDLICKNSIFLFIICYIWPLTKF